ncbi:MAG: hypothetical protein GXO91_11170 [FCB group bacterium]|nr:hypothetical protein [FCB group bacterium]
MRNKLLVILTFSLLAVYCSKEAPAFPWSKTSFADAQIAAGTRLIQLEFFTNT